jgi:Restriction endonuclease
VNPHPHAPPAVGWSIIPHELLLDPDFRKIEALLRQEFTDQGAATRDLNALRCLLDAPSQHVWITFEDGCMWWCTVEDGPNINPNGEDQSHGNFWLACDRPWSNRSLGGRLLAVADLPGIVTVVAGFRGTVSEPRASEGILRVIKDEQSKDTVASRDSRIHYVQVVSILMKQLRWKDFEQLVQLILDRTGWTRISVLGGNREGIDIEVANLTSDEIAFVQVKSSATQAVLDEYVGRFDARRDRYARMIFAVHSVNGPLISPADSHVQLWTCDKLGELVVRLGLGELVESKL